MIFFEFVSLNEIKCCIHYSSVFATDLKYINLAHVSGGSGPPSFKNRFKKKKTDVKSFSILILNWNFMAQARHRFKIKNQMTRT